MVIGARRIGKTSLLRQAKLELEKEGYDTGRGVALAGGAAYPADGRGIGGDLGRDRGGGERAERDGNGDRQRDTHQAY